MSDLEKYNFMHKLISLGVTIADYDLSELSRIHRIAYKLDTLSSKDSAILTSIYNRYSNIKSR